MPKSALLAILTLGCATLEPRLLQASVQKPSNVALYFNVVTNADEPVAGLTAEQFRIYEDNKLVSSFESKQTILNPEVSVMHALVLLVDMSGSVKGSGALPALQDAVSKFTEKVGKLERVAVYAFDGRKEIIPIVGFGGNASGAADALANFHSKDPSTNLNGAVVEALGTLQHELDHGTAPVRLGTLVVFTDGTDQAHRVSREQLMAMLGNSNVDVFAIGVGAEVDGSELHAIGRSGVVLSQTPGAVGLAFDQIAARIEAYSKSFYLLSYCSPSRAGVHQLSVEPFLPNGTSGRLSYVFSADGFGPDCDPNRKPSFDTKHQKTQVR